MALITTILSRNTFKETNILRSLLNKRFFSHHVKPIPIRQNIRIIAQNNVFRRNISLKSIFITPTQADLYREDDMPSDYQLIYNNKLTLHVIMGQLVSGLAVATLVLTTVRFDPNMFDIFFEEEMNTDRILLFTAFASVTTMSHIILSQLPLRIYYNRKAKRYVFIEHGRLPLTTRRNYYRRGEVRPTYDPENSLNPWAQSKYKAKESSVYLFDNFFRKPSDLNILIGYEKDYDDDDDDASS